MITVRLEQTFLLTEPERRTVTLETYAGLPALPNVGDDVEGYRVTGRSFGIDRVMPLLRLEDCVAAAQIIHDERIASGAWRVKERGAR